MRRVFQRNSFHSDFSRQKKRGKDFPKLDAVVTTLVETGRLDAKRHPHKLHGKYAGLWECHIESDWLLIYDVTEEKVLLVRTGTHTDLFE